MPRSAPTTRRTRPPSCASPSSRPTFPAGVHRGAAGSGRRAEGRGAGLHGRGRGRAQPAGPPEPAPQPALGRLGPPHHRQLRDAGGQRHPSGTPQRRVRGGPPGLGPAVAHLLHPGQGRDRIARGGPRRDHPGAAARRRRPAGVPAPGPPGRAAGGGRRLHRGHGRARRRRPGGHGLRRDPRTGAGPVGAGPGAHRGLGGSRRWWPVPPSSSSRVCTSPSASTRRPPDPAPTYRGRG